MFLQKNKLIYTNIQEHPYFLVTPSIIPILTSISVLFFVTEIINFFNIFSNVWALLLSYLTLTAILFEWFRNVSKESKYHTKLIQFNNKVAFMFFISTEVMFFFSLFWAFFHGSFSPAVAFNNLWPPQGITIINAFGPPIWGTWVLWMSSIFGLYVKDLILFDFRFNKNKIIQSYKVLLVLAVLFTTCQLCEFYLATFSFREGLYGSIFYLLTGFHGIHVIIGSIFLLICWFRICAEFFGCKAKPKANREYFIFSRNTFAIEFEEDEIWNPKHYSGLQASIWYWQFVDIVWIFVWSIIYIWGNNSFPFTIIVE